MDYCFTYFSSAIGSTTEQVVVELIDLSREKNARLGITGMMLHMNGRIVQVLEGPQNVVEALYKKIQADPRHTDVRLVISQPIARRLFGDWYMGYETLTGQQYEQVRELMPMDEQDDLFWEADQPVIIRMLKGFVDLNSRQRADLGHL